MGEVVTLLGDGEPVTVGGQVERLDDKLRIRAVRIPESAVLYVDLTVVVVRVVVVREHPEDDRRVHVIERAHRLNDVCSVAQSGAEDDLRGVGDAESLPDFQVEAAALVEPDGAPVVEEAIGAGPLEAAASTHLPGVPGKLQRSGGLLGAEEAWQDGGESGHCQDVSEVVHGAPPDHITGRTRRPTRRRLCPAGWSCPSASGRSANHDQRACRSPREREG